MQSGQATGGRVWHFPSQKSGPAVNTPFHVKLLAFVTPEILVLMIIVATALCFGCAQLMFTNNIHIFNYDAPETNTGSVSSSSGYIPKTFILSPIPAFITVIMVVIAFFTIPCLGNFSIKSAIMAFLTGAVIAFTGTALSINPERQNISLDSWAQQRYQFTIDDSTSDKSILNGSQLYSGMIIKDTKSSIVAELKEIDNRFYLYNPFTSQELKTATDDTAKENS